MAILNDLIVSGPSTLLSDVNLKSNLTVNGTITGSLSGNASTASSAYTLCSDETMKLYAQASNEVNFGGTNNSNTIYFGYKAVDSKPIPAKFVFGGASGTSELVAAKFTGALNGNAYTASHTSAGGYCTAAGYSGGYYKININSATAWMLNFTIKVYQGYRADDIQISGYNYGVNHWYSPSARLIASSHTDAQTVHFGYDSNYNLWVAIPASSYTGIEISEVCNGYERVDSWTDLFTITFQSSLTGTIQTTQTIYRPWYRDEKPSYTYSEVGAAPAYTYQTSDPGAGSSLTTGKLLIVYS